MLEAMLPLLVPLAPEQMVQNSLISMLPIIAILLFIEVMVIALFYMLGNAMQSQNVLAIAKDNMGSLAFTVVIIGLFTFLFSLFSSLTSALVCEGTCDFLEAARYSTLMLKSKLISEYLKLYVWDFFFTFMGSMGFSIPLIALSPATLTGFLISFPSISFSPLSGLLPLGNAHTIIVEAVGTAMLAVIARQTILEFVMNYMPAFFVVGAALRAWSFTRRTGSSLLAICVVAYFVYPSAILFTNYAIFQAYHPPELGLMPTTVSLLTNSPEQLEEYAKNLEEKENELFEPETPKTESSWYNFWTYLGELISFIFGSFLDWAKLATKLLSKSVLGFVFAATFTSPYFFSSFFDFLVIELQSAAQLLSLVFISFVVEIIIVISMYRSIATLLEGELEIFGLNKLV